jgi:hypothetical protein
VDGIAIELVVPDVLQAHARVEPWPNRRAQREPVILALVLILRVEADVGVFVGLRERGGGEEDGISLGMDSGEHAEGADLEPMVGPVRLEGCAAIR